MTYQEREKFKNWLLDRSLADFVIDGIMAEYDRLDELNKQQLEIIGESIQFVAKWTNDHDSVIGQRMIDEMEAAIRAAEES